MHVCSWIYFFLLSLLPPNPRLGSGSLLINIGLCTFVLILPNLSLNVPLISCLLQVFLFQKSAVHKCNMAEKPAIITRVVDSMTDNLRPTHAEATDVANAVLDGWYFSVILLGHVL